MRVLQQMKFWEASENDFWDTSAGTGKLCILGHLGLVFIWSCFVSCLLFLLFYVSLRNLCSGTCRKIRFLGWYIQVKACMTVSLKTGFDELK